MKGYFISVFVFIFVIILVSYNTTKPPAFIHALISLALLFTVIIQKIITRAKRK